MMVNRKELIELIDNLNQVDSYSTGLKLLIENIDFKSLCEYGDWKKSINIIADSIESINLKSTASIKLASQLLNNQK